MAIDDNVANREAQKLENLLLSGDTAALQNRLVSDSQAVDKDSFNKVMNCFKELNNKDRQACPGLPEVEIHNDFFGFGSTDQITVKHGNGKKEEVFENQQHRQDEIAKEQAARQQGNVDLGREIGKFFSSDWVNNTPDFQKDSSSFTQQNNQF